MFRKLSFAPPQHLIGLLLFTKYVGGQIAQSFPTNIHPEISHFQPLDRLHRNFRPPIFLLTLHIFFDRYKAVATNEFNHYFCEYNAIKFILLTEVIILSCAPINGVFGTLPERFSLKVNLVSSRHAGFWCRFIYEHLILVIVVVFISL